MQNIPLAMAIILISFPSEIQHEVLVVPIFYGIAITPLAMLGAWLLRNLDPVRAGAHLSDIQSPRQTNDN